MKLTQAERQDFAAGHPDWTFDGESISRTVQLQDFGHAIGFVVRLGFLAEADDHHPDIDIRWNKVTLVLTTHDQNALTEKDTSLAAAIDGIV